MNSQLLKCFDTLSSWRNRSFVLALFLLSSSVLLSQTNPTPHDLSSGSWTLTGWASNVVASSYPGNGATGLNNSTGVMAGVGNGNMMFWTGVENPSLPALANGDYTGNYNATSASRINGLGADGFSMVMTGTAGQGRPNSAVLALDATGRENIAVQWTAGTVTQATASPTPREHRIRLQYRIGNAGTWMDVPGPIEYSSEGKAAGHTQNMGNTTLPAACNNQAELYVRWVYYQHAANSGGDRARLRIDDITVSSALLPPPATCATEDFQNMPANNSSYSSRTWTGTDGFTWTAEGARTDRTLNGRAICFGTSGNRWVTSATYPNGIGTLSFDYVRDFTGTNARALQVWVNGTQIGGNITVDPNSDVVQSYNQVLNISGNVQVQIRSVVGSSSNQIKIDDITWTCYIPSCSAPTAHASAVTSASVTNTTATINWTSGDGNERIVVMRAVSDVNANPVNNTTYTANAAFGSGSQIGSGNFVVFKGSGNSVNVTGLTPGTVYYVKIFEFSCAAGAEDYFVTGTPGNTNFFTRPNVATNLANVCTNATSIDLTWAPPSTGDFDGYVLVGRTTANELSVAAIDPTGVAHDLDFNVAQAYGAAPQGRFLYVGNNTTATVTGLTNNTAYTFRIYTYKKVGSAFLYSTSSAVNITTGLNNVTNAQAAAANNGAFVSWTNPNATCYDEVMVVGSNASVTLVPTGDGSAYTPNSAYAGPNSIIFKSPSLNTVDVTNLANGDTYFFKIFVRNGTTWSTGIEVSVVPADVTVLNSGDMAVIAVNTQYLGAGGDDEICFIAFKDIKPGTSIEFTDNGYERVNTGQWGNTEGTIRITYIGATDILAGTPICLQGSGANASNFQVLVCGVNTPADWNITSLNGNFYSFDLNQNDQVWIFQNGAWNAGANAQHNATYSGNVVWGWTATGWQAAPGYASTAGSTLVPGTECFNTNTQIPNPDKVKYTGPLTAANQSEWVARINDAANWTGYANNTAYNGVAGRDYSGSCVSFTVSPGGFQSGLWTGNGGTNWFSCSNWDDLQVPTANVDVVIPNTANKPVIGAGVAECRNITIEASSNLTMNDVNSELLVYGNWNNNSGGDLGLSGDENATVKFVSGSTQVIGGSDETRFQNLIIENGTLVNLNRNTRVGGNGLLRVTGAGAQLGATHNPGSQRTLNIQGNTTMELVSGGSMNDNAFEHLTIITEGNSSTATFSGNGETIKCFNFTSIKTGSGGATLLTDTPLSCFNNFRVDYSPGTAVFEDKLNTITVGDDIRLKGSAANFDFTGTIVMTLENSGSGQADIEVESANQTESIQAELNNLIINSTNDNASVRFQGMTGNGIITIKNDFTIESMGANQQVNVYSNTIRIGGVYTNNMGEAYLNEGNSTFSFFGANTNQILCVDTEKFYNLNLNKTGNTFLQIGTDVEVENVLSFNSGVMQTGSNTLTITNDAASALVGGSTSGANNFIEGRLIRATNNGNYQFPIGANSFGAQGFEINVSGSGNVLGFLESNNTTPLFDRAYCDIETTTAVGSLVGQGTAGPDGFLDQMIFDLNSALQWNVTNPGGGISTYDITVNANGANDILPVVSATNSTPIRFLLKNGEPGNTGVAIGNVPDEFDEDGFLACPNGYTLSGMTGFSTFTINGSTGANTALPIELLYFDAVLNGKVVDLLWATASEINNDYFNVERSVDGQIWERVLQVEGAGTTNQRTNYMNVDPRPLSGVSYYRLKQTDFDGAFSYSNIVAVVVDSKDQQLLKIVNLLGQEVDANTKGLIIFIFSNGETFRVVNE